MSRVRDGAATHEQLAVIGSEGNKMKIRRTGGLSVLRTGGAIALVATLIGVGFACVDPKGDYDNYLERTNTMRGSGAVDATPFEVGDVDVNAGNATYFVSCLPAVFISVPETSMLMYMEANVSGGKVSFQNYPLKDSATKFAKSETIGAPHGVTDITMNADNTFTANIGTVLIPGKSQRITDSDLEIVNVAYETRILSNDRMCAELQGTVTKPTPSDLMKPGDFCVIVRMNEGDDLPKFTDSTGKEYVGFAASEYHCP
jgi:hypothetical protein